MRKQICLIASLLLFASCGSNSISNTQSQQAQIDSIAKARAVLRDDMNKKRNDSIINAMAKTQADSMEKLLMAKKPK